MRFGLLTQPKHWYERAEELLRLAEEAHTEETRRMLLRMVDDNLFIAKQVSSAKDLNGTIKPRRK